MEGGDCPGEGGGHADEQPGEHAPLAISLCLLDSHGTGGNTRTVMVAAVAPEAQHIEESISTCRFAQRVAMISNK